MFKCLDMRIFTNELGKLILLMLLLAGGWSGKVVLGQPVIDSVCVLTDYQPIGGHAVYLDALPGSPTERFVFDSLGGVLTMYSDSSANITGRVMNDSLPNLQWDVDIWLVNRRTFSEWKGLQRKIKIELAPTSVVTANKQNWVFYEMDSTRSRLTGVPGTFYDSDTLTLSHMPADFTYGFQMGVGANAKNGNFGISGWFFYGGSYSGHGDVNANASCGVPSCDLAIDSVVTECLNDSTFEVKVTLSGSGTNYELSDDQGSPVLSGLTAGTYSIGTFSNNTVVTVYAMDLSITACADTAAPVTADCTPPPPSCDLNIDSVSTTCLNDSTFEVVVTLSGTGTNYEISDDQGTTPVSGLGAGTYNFGSYANNTSVTIFAADLNLTACADTAAPVTADCSQAPVCDVVIDTMYALCKTDSTFEVVVTISGSGSNYELTDDQGSAPVSGLSAGTYNLGPYLNSIDVFVTVTDLNLPGCSDMSGPVTADCTPVPVCDVVIDSVTTTCFTDSTFGLVVTFTGSGTYTLSDDKGTPPDTGLVSGTYMYGVYPNDEQVTIFVTDPGIFGCSVSAGPFTDNCAPPVCDVSLDTMYALCVTDSTFEVVVEISGSGSNYEIVDDQGSAPWAGLSAGIHNIGPYLNSIDVYITVTDLNFGPSCSFFNGPVTADCTPVPICDVVFDSVKAVCLNDSTFEIQVSITGSGTNYSLSDGGINTPLTGLSSGTHILGPYNSGDTIVVQVNDPGIFGCVKFSQPTSADCENSQLGQKEIFVSNFYPNPSDDQTAITIYTPRNAKLIWELVDQFGKPYATGSMLCVPGPNTLNLATMKLPVGIYVIHFRQAGVIISSKKLMVLH